MRERVEYQGLWWLPDREKDEVCGTLTFDPDGGLRLSLMGAFEPTESLRVSDPWHVYPVVHGVTEGRCITLVDCSGWDAGVSFPGFDKESIRAQWALLGREPVPPPDVDRICQVTVEFTHLPEWAHALSGGKAQIRKIGNKRDYAFEYSTPEPRVAVTPFGRITLSAAAGFPLGIRREHTIDEKVFLTVERDDDEAKGLEWWLTNVVTPLQDLLSLGVDQPCDLVRVTVGLAGNVWEMGDGSQAHVPFDVAFVSRTGVSYVSPAPRIARESMLFTLDDISDEFEAVLSAWLSFAGEMTYLRGLYFGDQYRRLYIDNRYSQMIQAAETFHRASTRYVNHVSPKAEFRNRRKRILSCIADEADCTFVQSLFMHANEPRLRQRLGELGRDFSPLMTGLVGDIDAWAHAVASMRNTRTHAPSGRLASDNSKLADQRRQVALLLRACLLRELGLPVELIERIEDYRIAVKKRPQIRDE